MNQYETRNTDDQLNEELKTALEKRLRLYVEEAEKLRNEYYFDTKRIRRTVSNKGDLGSLGLSVRRINGRENAIQIVWLRFKLMPSEMLKDRSLASSQIDSERQAVELPMRPDSTASLNRQRKNKHVSFSTPIKKGSGGKCFRYKSGPIKKFALEWEYALFNKYEDQFALIREGMKFCKDAIRAFDRLNPPTENAINNR